MTKYDKVLLHSCSFFNPFCTSRTNKLLSMSISVPQLVSVGKYELSGQALVPLEQSSGTYKTTFQDVLLNGESKIKVQYIVWGLVDPYRFLIVLCQRFNDDSLACDPVIPIK
jgi:hypothetical protein